MSAVTSQDMEARQQLQDRLIHNIQPIPWGDLSSLKAKASLGHNL